MKIKIILFLIVFSFSNAIGIKKTNIPTSGSVEVSTSISSTGSSTWVNVNALHFVGSGSSSIGTATARGVFHVVGEADFEYFAEENDSHAHEIDVNANGFSDVKALDIDYITGSIEDKEEEAVILVQIDETGTTGGEVTALEVLSTDFGNSTIIGMRTGVGIVPLEQFSGEFVPPSTILVNGVDKTSDLTSGGAGNVDFFENDNDTVTIGSIAKFEEVEFLISTNANRTIRPDYEYSTGVGTWSSFGPTDGTNGFQNTGVIIWDLISVPTWAIGSGGEYLIRITRTRNSLTTTPIVDEVKDAEAAFYRWDENGNIRSNSLSVEEYINLDPVASPPASLTPSSGDIYVDSTGNEALCVYLNGGWVVAAGTGSCN